MSPRVRSAMSVLLLATAASVAGCSGDSTPAMSGAPATTAGATPVMSTAGTTAPPPTTVSPGGGEGGAAGMPSPSAGIGGAGTSGGLGGGAGQAGASGQGGSSGSSIPTGGSAPEAGGSAGSAMPGGDGGSTQPPACAKGTVQAAEVVFIGESFIALSGDIPRFTTALARSAGTIGMGESYRSYAVSGTQLTTGDIPRQFMRAVAAGPVKVVLMDGGGNDLLQAGRCQNGFDAACMEIVEVVRELFAQMKTDGVTDVVYFFYPDPMGIGAQIKEAMDILRPEMKKQCDGATDVRCVWVDQRESWDGNYDRFTSDGIHPTAAGSMASAQQIWDAMVDHCIAQ